jgi:hypothetical protein
MTRGLTIGLVIALMGIIGGMAIVHHHEDQDREREIFRYQQGPNGVSVEVNPNRIPFIQPPQRDDYYRPRSCNSGDLLNLHRAAHVGHETFHLDRNLCEEARIHAEYMARNNRLTPYSRYGCASNIAYGPTCEVDVFGYWMGRSQYRHNIMNGYKHRVGFGSAYDQHGKVYWCAIYR